MAEIAEINGIAVASVSKVNGIAKSALTNLQGFTFPASGGTPTTYLDEDFNSLGDGNGTTINNFPTNWNGDTGLTIYSSTTSTHRWRANDYRTSSPTTGPNSHHGGSDSSGAFGNTSDAYMYTEASGIYDKNHLLRTPQLDFSNSLANGTLNLTFWFHMGSAAGTDYMGELMVGVSDSATSAADGSVGTGFSAKADDPSGRTGMSIEFWDDASDDGSSTTTAIVIEGRQQTGYHTTTTSTAYWRKATVDLNAVAGESSVYIWFYARTGALYQSDICIDTVLVTGEE